MVHCIDCNFWEIGVCNKITEDGVDIVGGARIKLRVLDDSGLTVEFRTSGSFGCVLGELKPVRKKKTPMKIPTLQELREDKELQRKVDDHG